MMIKSAIKIDNLVNLLTIGLIFIGLIVQMTGCRDNVNHEEIHDSIFNVLIQLEGADNIFVYTRDDGSVQLSYIVKEQYPATQVIKKISNKLTEMNWKPLKEDLLNPGILSSHTKGWEKFEDLSQKQSKIIKQWIGDWKNKDGNTVRYVLVYQNKKDENENLSLLQVNAIYLPVSSDW